MWTPKLQENRDSRPDRLQIVIATMRFTLDRPPGIYQAIWEAIAPALPLGQ